MKTSFTKHLFVAVAALFGFAHANAQTITICNCDNPGTYDCTDTITVDIQACNKSNVCISMAPITHTLAPGQCANYTFSPPAGYALKYNTSVFTVHSGAYHPTFGNSSTTSYSNCIDPTGTNCGITHWTMGSNTSYTICPDLIVGCRKANANEGIAGVKELSNITTCNLYPNPTFNEANFSFSLNKNENVKLEVYNSLGAMVYSSGTVLALAGENKITIEGLGTGMYDVVFKTEGGLLTRRLVIQK